MSPEDFAEWFNAAHEDRLTALNARIELSAEEPGVVVLEGLMIRSRRKHGRGRLALDLLCDAADEAGVMLAVKPQPLTLIVDDPIPLADLERFYAGSGFQAPETADGPWLRASRVAAFTTPGAEAPSFRAGR